MKKIPRNILKLFIFIYQNTLGYLFPPDTCRFHPSCSEYAMQAVEKHGAFKGGIKAVNRLLRCNPWNSGGYDPVN
ncbi:MAG: membrane protein insertion efficiency factor YidD [candidate division Zixibacteria bacterium]|nr:membrane protein insertion efficiency factor YidD [candidate division Zixibacteria bacterium]